MSVVVVRCRAEGNGRRTGNSVSEVGAGKVRLAIFRDAIYNVCQLSWFPTESHSQATLVGKPQGILHGCLAPFLRWLY